jgi:transcriptional regulator with XRE-family HTH domain
MKGKELKEMRLAKKMSQKQVAQELGYTINGEPNKSQIARLEGGYAPINKRLELAIRYILE